MTRSQRLTFLAIAAVIAVVAVVTLAGGSDDTGDEQAATPTPTPEVTGMAEGDEAASATTPEPTAAAAPKPVLLTASGDPKTVRGTQGERVSFRVRAAADDELHVHGYDIERELPAGKTVTVTIRDPNLTGIYDIELHESDQEIGSLRIDPK